MPDKSCRTELLITHISTSETVNNITRIYQETITVSRTMLMFSLSPSPLSHPSPPLINYWCSEAVGGLAAYQVSSGGGGAVNGHSPAPVWGAIGHPYGSREDTTFLFSVCEWVCVSLCTSGARLTAAVTATSACPESCFYNYWLLRDTTSMSFYGQHFVSANLLHCNQERDSGCTVWWCTTYFDK